VIYVLQSISECVKVKRQLPGDIVVCDLPADFNQLAVLILSTLSSAAMLAYKLGLVDQIRLRILLRASYKQERDALLENLIDMRRSASSAPAVPVGAVQSAGSEAAVAPVSIPGGQASSVPAVPDLSPAASPPAAPPPAAAPSARSVPTPAPAPLNPEFSVRRNLPTAPAGSSGSSSSGGVRGTCPGCNRSVLSTDDGRVKEGDNYYHQECVKGPCSKCGKSVYADQERGREGPGAPYYHITCPPERPSLAPGLSFSEGARVRKFQRVSPPKRLTTHRRLAHLLPPEPVRPKRTTGTLCAWIELQFITLKFI
jgi:hypothetical protein